MRRRRIKHIRRKYIAIRLGGHQPIYSLGYSDNNEIVTHAVTVGSLSDCDLVDKVVDLWGREIRKGYSVPRPDYLIVAFDNFPQTRIDNIKQLLTENSPITCDDDKMIFVYNQQTFNDLQTDINSKSTSNNRVTTNI